MKIIKYTLIFLVSFITTSCTWIGRDYYFNSNNPLTDWSQNFKEGRGSDKSGIQPDTMNFIYENSSLMFSFNIGYQDTTIFGPIIIPVIPLPWDYSGDLYINVKINTKLTTTFDLTRWQIKIPGTNKSYTPIKASVYGESLAQEYNEKIPSEIKIDGNYFVRVWYPIKFSDAEIIEISFGDFSIKNQKITPQMIQLQKTKGNWHYNQFTL